MCDSSVGEGGIGHFYVVKNWNSRIHCR